MLKGNKPSYGIVVGKKQNSDFKRNCAMKVLYVEDNTINRLVFQKMLQQVAEVTTVETGKEGIALAKDNFYNVIFIDLNLNDLEIDGFEVLKEVKDYGHLKESKFIALTAYNEKEWEDKCQKAGFDNFISKPFNKEDLIKQIMY